LGLSEVIAGGLTPYPRQSNDIRLPHVIAAAERKLAKTALGAEKTLTITHWPKTTEALEMLATQETYLVGLEQTRQAKDLKTWQPPSQHVALVVGHEINGLSQAVIRQLDAQIMIPMKGHKESLNVAAAGSIAMYALMI
jgi:TrmH family RNA methyltransferase